MDNITFLVFSSLITIIIFFVFKILKNPGGKMTAEQLRDGIFSLRTRRFGSVAEVMIKRMLKLKKGKNLFHDLYDDFSKHRVEVKFSTVQKKNVFLVTEDDVLKAIDEANNENRAVHFSNWGNVEFDSNIQQVKKREFEILYYGLFFYDKIVIFKIKSSAIGSNINYSDKQHKGNIGEGQFHITQDILQYHLDNYHYKTITYSELLDLLTE